MYSEQLTSCKIPAVCTCLRGIVCYETQNKNWGLDLSKRWETQILLISMHVQYLPFLFNSASILGTQAIQKVLQDLGFALCCSPTLQCHFLYISHRQSSPLKKQNLPMPATSDQALLEFFLLHCCHDFWNAKSIRLF